MEQQQFRALCTRIRDETDNPEVVNLVTDGLARREFTDSQVQQMRDILAAAGRRLLAYRDYLGLPPEVMPASPRPVVYPPPRPGHGIVFVNEGHDDWCASWQDGDRMTDFHGTKADALTWAHAQPADNVLMFSPEANTYVSTRDTRPEPGPAPDS